MSTEQTEMTIPHGVRGGEIPATAKSTEPPDFWNLLAISRGAAPGWRWMSIQVLGSAAAMMTTPRSEAAVLLKGAVCTAIVKSGPHKGNTSWRMRDRATEREFVVTFRDMDVFTAKWEIETDTCSKCGGDGLELERASQSGNTYRPCTRCKATGKPVAP